MKVIFTYLAFFILASLCSCQQENTEPIQKKSSIWMKNRHN